MEAWAGELSESQLSLSFRSYVMGFWVPSQEPVFVNARESQCANNTLLAVLNALNIVKALYKQCLVILTRQTSVILSMLQI